MVRVDHSSLPVDYQSKLLSFNDLFLRSAAAWRCSLFIRWTSRTPPLTSDSGINTVLSSSIIITGTISLHWEQNIAESMSDCTVSNAPNKLFVCYARVCRAGVWYDWWQLRHKFYITVKQYWMSRNSSMMTSDCLVIVVDEHYMSKKLDPVTSLSYRTESTDSRIIQMFCGSG